MRTVEIKNSEEITSIIKACKTCFVGMAGQDGQPYVLPMNFGYENGEVILHTAPQGRIVDVLKGNPKVCITFFQGEELCWMHEHVACSYRVKSTSVVLEGEVRFVTDYDEKEKYLHLMMKQYSNRTFKFNAPAVKNVNIMVMRPEQVSAKEFGADPKTPWVR